MVTEPKSSEEYAKDKGIHCPACGSDQLTGSDVNIDAGYASQEIICSECGAEWYDLYTLTAYTNFEPGDSDANR